MHHYKTDHAPLVTVQYRPYWLMCQELIVISGDIERLACTRPKTIPTVNDSSAY